MCPLVPWGTPFTLSHVPRTLPGKQAPGVWRRGAGMVRARHLILSTILHPHPQSLYLPWQQPQRSQAAVTPYTRVLPSVSSAWGTAWAAEVSWRASAGTGRLEGNSPTPHPWGLNLFPPIPKPPAPPDYPNPTPLTGLGMISTPVPRESCWAALRRPPPCGSHYSKKLAGPHTQIICTLCAAPLYAFRSAGRAQRPTRRRCGRQRQHPLGSPSPLCWRLLWHSPASWVLWPSRSGQVAACPPPRPPCPPHPPRLESARLSLNVFIFVPSSFLSFHCGPPGWGGGLKKLIPRTRWAG